ncbi:winged helix-turn-helix domain-containing protein [Halomarina pelagica]|uniref:winged helix-turn-helix domain-containing protein n=1 Tax=Halomarina pelagica TaxID=2961599 RepID=UPI0020C27CC8|nr:winged helix-turn-helix domain-containing protein [Halomarina sp. BND7]
METALWYMLAGARGGPNRIRIVRALRERPRNANQLAEDLGLDYTTIRYHLDVLMDHDVVRNSGGGYGTVYLLTDRIERNWTTVESVIDTLEDA